MTTTVHWDGRALNGTIAVDGQRINVSADRETIHRHAPGFNDALTWEIERYAEDIFSKLKPYFVATYASSSPR